MVTGGLMGKILKVNLTLGKVHEDTLSEKIYRAWLGGYGLGVRVIYKKAALLKR